MPTPEKPALLYPGYVDIIDISKYQGKPDFKKVKAAGFLGVVVKVSEGVQFCDGTALDNLKRAREADLYTMVYSFARPSQGHPDQQVQKMFDCAGDQMPQRVVLDLESAPDDWLPQQKVEFGEAFVQACEPWTILKPLVYTYPHFARQMQPNLASSTILAACPLWIAHYMSTTVPWVPPVGFQPHIPKPWTDWAMHQYSGDGGYLVPGVVGACDRNLFNGDEAALRAFFGLPDADDGTEDTIRIVHPMPDFEPPT